MVGSNKKPFVAIMAQGFSALFTLTNFVFQVCCSVSAFLSMASQLILEFLRAVDSAPPSFVESVALALHQGGFETTESLDMAEASEVFTTFPAEGENILTAPKRAFIRRAIAAASRPVAAPPSQALAVMQPPVQNFDHLNDIFGSGTSAEAVAAALAAKAPPVDVFELLNKIKCGSLPSSMILELAIWQALTADVEHARKHGRRAFTYVDFTSAPLLPPWLPRDAVGGRKGAQGSLELDPEAGTASLQALSSALQAAVAEPRSLRSIPQWSSIFWRYAPAAVATEQLDWCSAVAYHATVMRLAEQERLAKSPGWVAIQYDVALRKSWSRRCQQCDPNLDIMAECVKVNDDVLETVRAQIAAAASSSSSSAGFSRGASSHFSRTDSAAESVLAKAGAAAQAITRRAEAASREMAKAEQSLAVREDGLKSATVGGGRRGGKDTWNKGGKGGDSRKQQKTGHWQARSGKQRWS